MPPKDTQPLLAAIYDRVSKDKTKSSRRRGDARSVAEQNAANTAACKERGWTIAEVITESDRSASRFARVDRPGWDRLLEKIGNGDLGVIVLWESSRGDRKPAEWFTFLDICRERDVLIHITSHDRTYNMAKSRDWKVLADDGVDSAMDSEQTSERILRGTKERAAEGLPHGRKLYGYNRIHDSGTGTLIGQAINEEQAKVVREAAEQAIRGISLTEIAQRLNVEGVPSPAGKRWDRNRIKRLLVNPSFAGYRTHKGEKTLNHTWWPPILDEATHLALVARLTDPSRNVGREGAVKHLLTGIAQCEVCGSKVRVVNRRGFARYVCEPDRKLPKQPAAHVARRKEAVDEYVESLTIAFLQRPDALEILTQDDAAASELRRTVEALAAKRDELEVLYEEAAQAGLSAAGLARLETPLLEDIKALEAKAGTVRYLPHVGELLADGPEGVPPRWRALQITQQREVLRGIFKKIEIMRVGSGRHTFTDEESVNVQMHSRD